jgi:hypothetical protein
MSTTHESAVEDCVDMSAYWAAETALHNALGCDAYREEVEAARRAAVRLLDQCERLAGELSALARRATK